MAFFVIQGPRWVFSEMSGSSDDSVLRFVFPRKSSCQFQKFGSGGGIENQELLCVMAQNIISEKIFVFLWFWFVILASLDILNILSYILMIFKVAFVRKVFLARAVGSRKVRFSTTFSRHQTSMRQNLTRELNT